MKLKNPLLVVSDMEKSKTFYKQVLGLRVIADFGANVTLTGGLALQTLDSWMGFIQKEVCFSGNDTEVYFEEEDFDQFLEKIAKLDAIQYVHQVYEHRWGQRVVRIYDPDMHIIEVGESMKLVCRRFLDSGLSMEETAKRMDVPERFVRSCIR